MSSPVHALDMSNLTEADLTNAAQLASDIAIEIDALTQQVQPVLDRIKALKKQKTELKEVLQPMMRTQNVPQMTAPAVQINFKADAKKTPAFNRDTVKIALDEFFRGKNVNSTGADAVTFIDEFRKNHKVITETVSFKKAKNFQPPQITPVQPLRMTQAPTQRQIAQVAPYEV